MVFCRAPEVLTRTATHVVKGRQESGGSVTPKKSSDLLIFYEKFFQTIALQWIEAGMGFVISRSGVRVTPLAPQNAPKTMVFGAFYYAKSSCFEKAVRPRPTP